jgi:hypothetical protein
MERASFPQCSDIARALCAIEQIAEEDLAIFNGCKLATNTSLAMMEMVPSILAPRMINPVLSSSNELVEHTAKPSRLPSQTADPRAGCASSLCNRRRRGADRIWLAPRCGWRRRACLHPRYDPAVGAPSASDDYDRHPARRLRGRAGALFYSGIRGAEPQSTASRRASLRALQCGQPAYGGQGRRLHGLGERLCMRRQSPAASYRLPGRGPDR